MSTYFGVVKLRHVMVDPVNVEEAIVLKAIVSQSRKELVEQGVVSTGHLTESWQLRTFDFCSFLARKSLS